MEAPKCMVCDKRHFGRCPDLDATIVESPPASPSQVLKPDNSNLASVIDQKVHEELVKPLTQVERNRRWRAKNRDKYNAYMRDWRKRRRNSGSQGN